MKTAAGIFETGERAVGAVRALRERGVSSDAINVLAPGDAAKLWSDVPTTEAERPGIGPVLGTVVGAASGSAGGTQIALGITAAVTTVPIIGPVLIAGAAAGALIGAGAGALIGRALDNASTEGVPKDDVFVFEDALRRGRTIVVVVARDEEGATLVRQVMDEHGALDVPAVRNEWWSGLRDVERQAYAREGRDFGRDEAIYRHGFEAAQHPDLRGRPYPEALPALRVRYGDVCEDPAFQHGYARGLAARLPGRRDAA